MSTPITRVRKYAEAYASVHGETEYISRVFVSRGAFDLTVADLIAVTEATAAPVAPSSGDLHIRVGADGFRLYDGSTRISGPWGWNEREGALSALSAAKKAVSHGG